MNLQRSFTNFYESLEKARGLPVGTIQSWQSGRHRKVNNKQWVKVNDNSGMRSLFDEPVNITQPKTKPLIISEKERDNDVISDIESATDYESLKRRLVRNLKPLFGDVEVEINKSKISLETVKKHSTQLIKLAQIYNPKNFAAPLTKIKFGYAGKSAGKVTFNYQTGFSTLFLNEIDIEKSKRCRSLPRKYLSNCDEGNLYKAIMTHEFAHLAWTTYSSGHLRKKGRNEKMEELNSRLILLNMSYGKILNEIRGKLSKEKLPLSLHTENKNFVSEYASNNKDEFFAECFQEYINKKDSNNYFVKQI